MTVDYEDKHLYILIGGELEFVHMPHYRNLNEVKLYGQYNDRTEAVAKWRELAMSTIDNAHMKYQIVKVY